MSKAKIVVAGGLAYVAAVAVGYSYGRSKTTVGDHVDISSVGIELSDEQRHKIYENKAPQYDKDIGTDELFMGLKAIRWWHIGKATGSVLEIGCGTGRNFDYYKPSKVQSVLAVDSVDSMVSEALKKVVSKATSTSFPATRVSVMNAHSLPLPPDSFDTVVDTFGLCSFENPAVVLREMSRVCKEDGRVLLLEHGRGSYAWINDILDSNASRHAHSWGCIWNKDIENLVRDELEVVSITRWHFGTTYIIEAKPKKRKESE